MTQMHSGICTAGALQLWLLRAAAAGALELAFQLCVEHGLDAAAPSSWQAQVANPAMQAHLQVRGSCDAADHAAEAILCNRSCT